MTIHADPTIASPVASSLDGWTITPITGTFGAELTGGHVRDGIEPDRLSALLEEHLFLVLRDQHLTHAEQVALARGFGELTPAHPVVPGHPDHPEILVLDGAQGGRNARWHTDVTFVPTPPAISVLVGDAVPVAGGDTLWADLRTAYERLAAPLRALVDQLEAVHRISPLAYWGEPFDTALSREDAQQLFDQAVGVPPVIRAAVRVQQAAGADPAPPLAARRRAHLGQPGDHALRNGRLRHERAADAAGDRPRW